MDRSHAWQSRALVVLAAVVAVALADAGCRKKERPRAETELAPEDTVVPWSGPIDDQPYRDVLAYARKLTYDPKREPGDSVALLYEGQRGPGAVIFARRGNLAVGTSQLRRGWMIGLVRVPAGEPFPPFGIRSESTFVWVDGGGPGGSLRGVWIPGLVTSGQEDHPVKNVAVVLTAYEHPHAYSTASSTGPVEWPPVSLAAFRSTALLQPRGQTKQWTYSPDSVTTQGCWQTATTWLRSPSVRQ